MFKRLSLFLLLAALAVPAAALQLLPIKAVTYGVKCDGVTDDAAALTKALAAGNIVELPAGTCMVNSTIGIGSAKEIVGEGRSNTTLKAGTVGITVLNLADPTFNVRIRHLNIDGNAKALYGVASAGSSVAAHMIIEDVSVSGATSKNIYLKNMYYSDLVSVYATGGAAYGLHLETSGNNNIIGGLYYNHSTASIAVTAGATLNRFMGFRTYNDVSTSSPQLLFIDSSYGNVFIGGYFEPQGLNNVTNNVTLTKTGSNNCTDNQFLYNSFIGVPNTASANVIQIGSGGSCTKTQLVGNRFIKPTAGNSVRLTTQTSTVLRDNVDLVTYDTAVYAQVTVTNTSGNAYEITGLDGTYTTVTASGAVTAGTQVNVTGTNVNMLKGAGDQIKIAGSGGDIVQFDNNRSVTWPAVAIASLPAATNGSIMYCSDCTIANPCAGGGTGAIAKRLNGAWVCN